MCQRTNGKEEALNGMEALNGKGGTKREGRH